MLQTVVKTTDHVSQEQRVAQIQPLYLNTVTLVERLPPAARRHQR